MGNWTESAINGRNNSQHCWTNYTSVESCCVRLHVAKSLYSLKLCATSSNNAQQHATGCVVCYAAVFRVVTQRSWRLCSRLQVVQTDAKCNIRELLGVVGPQCCVRLHGAYLPTVITRWNKIFVLIHFPTKGNSSVSYETKPLISNSFNCLSLAYFMSMSCFDFYVVMSKLTSHARCSYVCYVINRGHMVE